MKLTGRLTYANVIECLKHCDFNHFRFYLMEVQHLGWFLFSIFMSTVNNFWVVKKNGDGGAPSLYASHSPLYY